MADIHDRLRAMTMRNLKPRSQGGSGLEGILRRSTSVYNPATDMNEHTTTDYPISGLRASYQLRHIDGELVRQGDIKFYLSPVLQNQTTDTPTPQTTDKLVYDSVTYIIVTVKAWRFADLDCGWLLQLRRT